jgi:hypothetical protein
VLPIQWAVEGDSTFPICQLCYVGLNCTTCGDDRAKTHFDLETMLADGRIRCERCYLANEGRMQKKKRRQD